MVSVGRIAGRGVEEGDEIGEHASGFREFEQGTVSFFGYNQAIMGKLSSERKLFVNEVWLPKVAATS